MKPRMNHETCRVLYRLGLDDAILSHFTVSGPLSLPMEFEVMNVVFSDGEVNVATESLFSDREMTHLRDRMRDEARIYHIRGVAAGHELVGYLSSAVTFERYIRSQWWYRSYYRTINLFEKAFALLTFWRYTWVVRIWNYALSLVQ